MGNRHLTRSLQLTRNRKLRSASHFLKFSPALLRFQLLPRWVFLSLLVNSFLSAILLTLLLRQTDLTGASSVSAETAPPNSSAALASTDAGASGSLGSLPGSLPGTETLAGSSRLSYQQWLQQLQQEAKIAAEKSPDKLTVLAGDSISLWFPESFLPDAYLLNQGISGETSAGLLKRLSLFDETRPSTIFVMIGINDLLRGKADTELLTNQIEIVRYLKGRHPQAQIILQSILPHAVEQVTWEGADRLLSIPNSRIQALNQEIAAIAKQEGVRYLNLYPLFANPQGDLRRELSTDGLHLNPQGYQVWSIALQVYGQAIEE